MSVSRRSLLLGWAAATAATTVGCRDHDASAGSALGPGDRSALRTAVAEERRILAAYDALPDEVDPGASMARDQHAAHLAAMQRVLAAASPSPSAPGSLDTGLPALVAGSGQRLQAAAVTARDGEVAALLASVAAAHLAPPPFLWHGEWFGEEDR